MESDYLCKLYMQYCNSVKKKFNIHEFITDKNFIDWIIQNCKRLNTYKNYLEYLGITIGINVAELNKGKFDSISSNDSIVISLFGDTLDKGKSELLFCGEKPIIVSNSSILTVNNIELFTTHNPYNIEYFKGIDKLHNIGYNIVFGVFGDLSDLDKKEKFKYIEYLEKLLLEDYKVEYETVDDTYMCLIKSERKIKRLNLIKTRNI